MTIQNNAPDAWRGVEGDFASNPMREENPNMHIISDPGHKYHGWTVRIGPDIALEPEFSDDVLGRGLVKIHCRISRTPGTMQFVIRSFATATAAERQTDLAMLPTIHRTFRWAECHGATNRIRTKAGGWMFLMWTGSAVEDPLVQLELEMMIDLSSGVRS